MVKNELDLSARITPAVGSTLPAIAAISGVATPLAGLAAYALMKIVPIVNEDLVTYRYEVTGTFQDPKIKDKGLNLEPLNLEQPSKGKPTRFGHGINFFQKDAKAIAKTGEGYRIRISFTETPKHQRQRA